MRFAGNLALLNALWATRFLLAIKVVGGSDVSIVISPPSQVAIAAGKDAATEVGITWITDDTRDDAASCAEVATVTLSPIAASAPSFQHECLRYSFSAGGGDWHKGGGHGRLFGNYTSGRIHRVRAANLVPNQVYTYRIFGDPAGVNRTFRTLPGPSDPRYPLVFGVIGDIGQTTDSLETRQQLELEEDMRLILHAGDLSYADTDSARWDSYFLMMEPLLSRMQWMVVPGNHEIESDYVTGINFVPYENRVVMPAVQPPIMAPSPHQVGCMWVPSNFGPPWPTDCTPSKFLGTYDYGNAFYAFSAGPVRVISLNCYTSSAPGSPQYNWLTAELESLADRRDQTPWLVVMLHCPFYNSNVKHVGEFQTIWMRDVNGLEELFHKHHVSLIIAGHVHAYERTFPVFQNSTTPSGPTYLVIGDGGNREGHASEYQTPQPSWSAFRNGTAYGHGRLTLVNDSYMLWEWLANPVTASAPQRRTAEDSAWIRNPYVPGGAGNLAPNSTWKVVFAVLAGLALLGAVAAVLILHFKDKKERLLNCPFPSERSDVSMAEM